MNFDDTFERSLSKLSENRIHGIQVMIVTVTRIRAAIFRAEISFVNVNELQIIFIRVVTASTRLNYTGSYSIYSVLS